ncbi:MAG: helix-turn-helix domain-containing protein [Acutalibacteraceae bacterium]
MDLGTKIRQLRYKAGLTQEQLADKLCLSPQSISKWENGGSMPDILLLPRLAEEFGVSIDELFDQTADQRMRRIENRMELENELPGELFWEYEEYLKDQADRGEDPIRAKSLLAHLYHHRMNADAARVRRYAHEAILAAPEKKECQWLLDMAQGSVIWDWNVGNHSRVIDFYKQVIREDTRQPQPPLPYYYLIDNLIADHRVKEAQAYLDAARKLPAFRAFFEPVYQAYFALAEFDEPKADAILEKAMGVFADNGDFLFEVAQYHARKCAYDQAIAFYEAAYASDTQHKPRYYDPLQGIAVIHEIRGEYQKAADTYDRILDNLRNEWGFTEETAVQEALQEKQRLLEKENERLHPPKNLV